MNTQNKKVMRDGTLKNKGDLIKVMFSRNIPFRESVISAGVEYDRELRFSTNSFVIYS